MEQARAKRGQQKTELHELTDEARGLLQTKADDSKKDDILIRINESIDKFKTLHLELMSYVDNDEEKMNEQVFYEDVITAIKDTTDMLAKYREDTIQEDESASSLSKRSGHSSTSSARIEAAKKRAALMVEAKMLKLKQELEREEQRVYQQRQELELKTNIAKAEAEEQVILEIEAERSSSNRSLKVREEVRVEDRESQSSRREPSKVDQQTRTPCYQSEGSNDVFLKENTYQTDYNNQQRLIDMLQAPNVEKVIKDNESRLMDNHTNNTNRDIRNNVNHTNDSNGNDANIINHNRSNNRFIK